MKDLMIDLETLGVNEDAIVLSIGAVFFDVETGELGQSYYVELDADEQLKLGRKINYSTILWWIKQSEAAKMALKEQGENVGPALKRFKLWVENVGGPDVRPWGNGSMFDIGIIESLLIKYDIPIPWSFRNIMDLRTFQRFVANGSKIPRSEGHHNAQTDAKDQALFVINHARKS